MQSPQSLRKPLRIGIDARLRGYRQGGISEYTQHLVTELAQLDTSNEYQIVYAARRPRPADLTPGPNFHAAAALTPCHHRLERLALAVEVSRLRLDILHSPDFIPPRFGARHRIISVMDLNFLYYPQFQTADSVRYYAGNIRDAVREADHILAISQSAKDDLCHLLNVPADKITVQLLGVEPRFQPLEADPVRAVLAQYRLPAGYVLFVGTFEPRKNLPGLMKAYRILLASLPGAPPLVIVGRRGWLYDEIFEQARDLGERIRWIEDLPPADLPAVYNGASALVLPSFYEGFGLTALEAMACGVPVIASDRGSLPEVVGAAGLLIDPDRPDDLAEALRRILTDDVLRQRCITAGRERAAGFTWRHAAEIALDVYRRVGLS